MNDNGCERDEQPKPAARRRRQFPPNFQDEREGDSALLGLTVTKRRRLRYVAKFDEESFASMVEAIQNTDSDDPTHVAELIESEQSSRRRSAESHTQWREWLTTLQQRLDAYTRSSGINIDRIIAEEKQLRRCAKKLGFEDPKLLQILIRAIQRGDEEQPAPEPDAPLADGLYEPGQYDEPGRTWATNLVVLRDRRALPGLQAAAAVDLVDSRRSIELAEQRDRRGGRPRKGTEARNTIGTIRMTPTARETIAKLSAAGVTSSDLIEAMADGYRKLIAAGEPPRATARAILIAIGTFLQQGE